MRSESLIAPSVAHQQASALAPFEPQGFRPGDQTTRSRHLPFGAPVRRHAALPITILFLMLGQLALELKNKGIDERKRVRPRPPSHEGVLPVGMNDHFRRELFRFMV